MRRRAFIVATSSAVVSIGVFGLAGCGFELRRAPDFHFKTIALVGFAPGSPIAAELTRSITENGKTLVVEAVTQAQVVLEAIDDARERSIVATTASGQVREMTLRARLNFRLRTPDGKILIAPTAIELTRDMSYDERIALAKEQEDALLFRAMQNDIAAQVVRRLAAVPTV